MNIIVLIKQSRSAFLLLVLLVFGQLLWLAPAQAHVARVTAEFTPNQNNPNNRTFTNTSPITGVCGNAHRQWCIDNKIASIATGFSTADAKKQGSGVVDHGRGSLYFSLPEQRSITVVSDTGETAELFLRITGFAFRYGQPDPNLLSGTRDLRGCRELYGNLNYSDNIFRILGRNDNGAGGRSSCAYEMLAATEFSFVGADILYELETPEPLNMKNGIYRATTNYTMGGLGSDIDFGDGVSGGDPNLRLEFTLTVNHLFAIDFAPGYETVNLQPLGGWNQWQEFGKVPATLRRDVPFRVSGSTDFAVDINCEYTMPDGRCGISNGPSTVPLDIAITMPGLMGHKGGMIAEALNYTLQKDVFVPRFSPMREGAVFQRSSYLRFEVNGDPIKEMVTHPSTEYKGRVTVIFDANM